MDVDHRLAVAAYRLQLLQLLNILDGPLQDIGNLGLDTLCTGTRILRLDQRGVNGEGRILELAKLGIGPSPG